MNKNWLCLLLNCIVILGFSQAPVVNFQFAKQIGSKNQDWSQGVAFDGAGNIYVTGSFPDTAYYRSGTSTTTIIPQGTDDGFVMKLDAGGNLIWLKQIAANFFNVGASIKADAAGNVYITGILEDSTDFDPGPGTYYLNTAGSWDIFVLKLDASGNFVWARQMGGPNNEYGASLALDAANNIYVTGYFIGTPDMDPGVGTYTLNSVSGGYDIFALKLDASGNFGWARQIGGRGMDLGYEIAVDGSSNSYITGTFEDTCDFNPGPSVYSLISKGYSDAFILKLNAAGNLVFAYQIGSSYTDYGTAVCVDPSGNCFVSGTCPDTINVHSASGTYTMVAADGRDIYIANYSSSGSLIRCLQTGGPSFGGVDYMTADPAGNIYLAGSFADTYDFDPSPSTYSLTSFGDDDGFIMKLDNSGNFIWAKQIGGNDNDDCISVAVNGGGDVVVAGTFKSTCDFDPGPSSYTYTEAGAIDGFVLKLTQSYSGIEEMAKQYSGIVYPNPSHEKVFIKLSHETGPVQVKLTAGTGQICYEGSFASSVNLSLDVSKLPAGLYLIEITSASGRSGAKLVKD